MRLRSGFPLLLAHAAGATAPVLTLLAGATAPARAQDVPPPQVAQVGVAPAAAALARQAGVAAGVRGSVQRVSGTGRAADARPGIGENLTSGGTIYLGDRIASAADSGMQVILLDQTVFTIGPDSEMSIDTFVFNPDGSGQLSASIARGAFRFVTGRIANNRPSDMVVKIPGATIGIRGTIVAGRAGPTSEVVLLGPGPEDNTGARIGRLVVETSGGVVDLARPGFGTVIGAATEPPSPAFRFPPQRIGAITTVLAPPAAPPPAPPTQPQRQQAQQQAGQNQPGQNQTQQGGQNQPSDNPQGQSQQPGPGGQATTLAGQGTATGAFFAGSFRDGDQRAASGNQAAQFGAQAAANAVGGVTTFDQLRSITSGTALFAANGITLTGVGSGFFGFSGFADFNARTITLNLNGNYTLGASPNYSGPIYSEVFNYTSQTGFAATRHGIDSAHPGDAAFFNSGFLATGQRAVINLGVLNDADARKLAQFMKVQLDLSNGGGDALTGSKVIPRAN